MFDRIGQQVYDKVKSEAETYKDELEGSLSLAKVSGGEVASSLNPCELQSEYTKLINGSGGVTARGDPCKKDGTGKEVARFSVKEQAEYDNKKMKCSNGGACAPYRRLSLCNKNMVKMDTNNNDGKAKHDLLADVCMAAKYEGASIKGYYPRYQTKYKDSPSQICTALARSFADIGDIVRGKDLYLGYDDEEKNRRDKLEKNLKTIFGNIYKDVMKTRGSNGKKEEIERRYGSDKDFFQLREDWWTLNRKDVWKAITCHAAHSDEYFRKSTDGVILYFDGRCGRELSSVPTYLDYVPQYLRWFDEWSEEFCRKRNITLKLAKEACRGEGNTKYCSLNGYDCTKRIEKRSTCSRENKCTACSNICNPYQLWLEKQQNEFNMQKDKYDKEIKKYVNNKSITNSNTKKEYYEEFYEELKRSYKRVHDFLTLLNNGRYCKEGVKGEKKDAIDFTKTGNKHAFYRSDYCQPCPDCLVVCNNRGCKENKKHDNCRSKIINNILQHEKPTVIDVLYSDDKQGVITKKLKQFCSNPTNYKGKNYKEWKCYNKNSDYNNCEMISLLYQDPKESNLMLSVQCFYSWAQNLLIDTIRWEHELKDCINNTNVTDCGNRCNKNCECYEKWINRKKDEWEKLKEVLKKKDENSHNYYKNVKNLFDLFLYP
ncbi:hypothetical protein PFTANZ_06332, partial [Plasmodium falciparum Tanzania (2000708)]